jgi:hypothetical protein
VLAIAYSVYPNPFLLGLVAALPSATVFIWRELRSTLREKMLQVWDSYLKPVRDTVSGAVVGSSYTFQGTREDLEATINWVEKRGKYGPFKLYPAKLFKQKLVSNLLTVAEDFNPKLNRLYETAKANGLEVHLYFAFDRWELRKIPPDQVKGLDAKLVVAQRTILDTLDETKKEEIADLKEPWERGLSLSKQIVSILNKFSSENGIIPRSVAPFVPLAQY